MSQDGKLSQLLTDRVHSAARLFYSTIFSQPKTFRELNQNKRFVGVMNEETPVYDLCK